jgi:hypothetical protein
MQPSRGSILRFFCFLALLLFCCRISAPVFAQEQTVSRSATPELAAPPEWGDRLRELAVKIAALSPPAARINLTVANLSSLGADDVGTIQSALKTQLSNRGFHFVSADLAETVVQVTLSEGDPGYIVVAQVRRNGNEQVAMVTVPRGTQSAQRTGGVTLDVTLVWQQAAQILDFALPVSADHSQNTMVVLDPGRLAFYTRTQSQWQFAREFDSQSGPASRDWRGHIDLSQGAAGDARWPRTECKGDFTQPMTVSCQLATGSGVAWMSGDLRAPFAPPGGGDAVSADLQCGMYPVALATGGDDWTQPDFVQAYEIRAASTGGAVASGDPVNFDGPVTAMWPGAAPGTARAIVHNLKTENYEAYVVTATCSL